MVKRLLVIVGDLSGAPELAELDFATAVESNFRNSYKTQFLIRPDDSQVMDALEDADAVVLFAHGSAGTVELRAKVPNETDSENSRLTFGDLEHLSNNKRFDFVWIAACHTVLDKNWVEFWLKHTDRLVGFDTITFGKGATDPILLRPDSEPRRIQSPGFRDWYPHPRHIWPEKHQGDLLRLISLWKWPIAVGLIVLVVVWRLLLN